MVKSSKQPYRLTKKKFLSEEEHQHVIAHTEHWQKPLELRDMNLIRLGLATGARAGELLNLTWDDIDPKQNTVYIHGIKNSNDRELPITEYLMERIMKMFDGGPQEYVFPIKSSRLIAIWHFYRPAPKGFHSLRHTFAIRLYDRTRDIRLVQVALGHRNINNTMIYAEYVYSKQELRKLLIEA